MSACSVALASCLAASSTEAQSAPAPTASARLGSGYDDRLIDVVGIGDGVAVLLGYSYGASDALGTTLAWSGEEDYALVRLDHDLALVWARRWGGGGRESARALAADASGRLFVVGSYADAPAEVGAVALPAPAGTDAFVAAYDHDGAPLWSRRVGGAGLDRLEDVAVDGDAVHAVGASDSATLDPLGGAALGSGRALHITLAARDGAVLRATREAADMFRAIAIGAEGPCVAGTEHAAWDRPLDGLVVCFGRDGARRWSATLPGAAFWGLALDPRGGVFAVGSLEGTLAAGALASAGGEDAVIVALDAPGQVRWARRFGGPAEDWCHHVLVDTAHDRVLGLASIRSVRGHAVSFGRQRFDPGPHSDVVLFALGGRDGADEAATALGSIDFDLPGGLAWTGPDLLMGMTFGVSLRAGADRLRARGGTDGAVIRLRMP